MAENEGRPQGGEENEGEGNRTAARRYNQGVQETVRRGDAEHEAETAAREVDANPDEFRRAEEEGKRHSAGDLPLDVGHDPQR